MADVEEKALLPGPWLLGVVLNKLGIPTGAACSILENTTTVL